MMTSESNYEVLVVDDVPMNLEVIGTILGKKGLKVGFAESGAEALRALSEHQPYLIVLDVSMPEMDGYEVCERLKKDPKTMDIPIIFLTARTQTEDIVRGFEVGGVDYITKPFNARELFSRVFTHLELKKSRDIIFEQNQRLKELNATKDKFFSIIAHDLKNPFNNVLSFSRILIKDWEETEPSVQKEFVEYIHESAERGYGLLENLLRWSGCHTGKLKANPQTIHLETLVADIVGLLRLNAADKGIGIRTDIEDELTIVADIDMISTVIRNLISNAVKFTPNNGEILISAKKIARMIEVSVSDTGIGISEEDIAKLFRVDIHHSTPGTANERGTGLGLILCREFVEKHGGTIRVSSAPGTGSCFAFTLPIPDIEDSP